MKKYKRKCIVQSVKIRISDIPGDFYFSWISYVYRIRSNGFDIKIPDVIVTPNRNKKYASVLKAYESGKRYMTNVFKVEVLNKKIELQEDIKSILNNSDFHITT